MGEPEQVEAQATTEATQAQAEASVAAEDEQQQDAAEQAPGE